MPEMNKGKAATSSDQSYDPKVYWGTLVRGVTEHDLDEVGHPDMGRTFNHWSYKRRVAVAARGAQQTTRSAQAGPSKVFEAGFGVGVYLSRWSDWGYAEVHGVDISPTATRAAQARFPSYKLLAEDIGDSGMLARLASVQSTFDLVTLIDVLYHIVDDERAARGLYGLGQLVAPGGRLLLTDKSPDGLTACRETAHVVRRPPNWYSDILAPLGFELEGTHPVFWCLDPPTPTATWTLNTRIAAMLYRGARLFLKPWPRNSWPQLALGHIVGLPMYLLDSVMAERMPRTENLHMTVYVRQ